MLCGALAGATSPEIAAWGPDDDDGIVPELMRRRVSTSCGPCISGAGQPGRLPPAAPARSDGPTSVTAGQLALLPALRQHAQRRAFPFGQVDLQTQNRRPGPADRRSRSPARRPVVARISGLAFGSLRNGLRRRQIWDGCEFQIRHRACPLGGGCERTGGSRGYRPAAAAAWAGTPEWLSLRAPLATR